MSIIVLCSCLSPFKDIDFVFVLTNNKIFHGELDNQRNFKAGGLFLLLYSVAKGSRKEKGEEMLGKLNCFLRRFYISIKSTVHGLPW